MCGPRRRKLQPMPSRLPEPTPPDPAACCGNGCSPCVWDVYEEARAEWRQAVAAADGAAQARPTTIEAGA
jgi:hypothetical protein